jgi:SAM-dependent methyltransferase
VTSVPSVANLLVVTEPEYLKPYELAADRHGGGFESLLWASPQTQRLRFEAICRAGDLAGKTVLDAGCGRADLLGFLIDRGIGVAEYIGLEAVDILAKSAENTAAGVKRPLRKNVRILRGDFVQEPIRLFVGAEVVVFSGSLNTLPPNIFYQTLAYAWEAAGEMLVFNYLSSTRLAGREYLHWHEPIDVLRFARKLSSEVVTIGDYLQGDTTMALLKRQAGHD